MISAMTPFEAAYEQVAELVRKFREHDDQYLQPKYQESEARADFIDKFFSALGWDVRHTEQTNPREQEVKIERGDSTSMRKADYAFYLKPDFARPVFLVEAKKPAVDLAAADPYFQTARYGFNTSTSVAVLTNFAEFHIIDCRRKPERVEGIVMSALLERYTYLDYLDRQKFGDIYWKFSREAVQAGKLKEYWKGLTRPKGATKQLRLINDQLAPIDEVFLVELEQYRKLLASEFKKGNPKLSSEALTEAAQKVLDRIVFIRFLEDKTIEPDFILDKFGVEAKGSSWNAFVVQSQKLDKTYNGVVFKKHFIDNPDFVPPNDSKFADMCDELSHHNSPYLFSYIPVEILGSIYERFLGKVVVSKGRGIAVEEKPEVRKAGGVYYTPRYIVDYIVEHTVGKLLEGKPPTEISTLRFADIACGSGSFLISIYEHIVHYLENWYSDHPENARQDECRVNSDGRIILSLSQKRRILRENIFGVDIDPQAVEVAQFSLFLKLLESETIATVQGFYSAAKHKTTETQQFSFAGGADRKVLPDISKNIVCGNSLVEYDIANLFPLSEAEEYRIKPFSFQSEFRQIISRGGFDVIVGNPPYGGLLDESVKKYIKTHYNSYQYKYDNYIYFIERAIGLVRKSGFVSFITPELWLRLTSASKLRQVVLTQSHFRHLKIWGEGVFRDAVVNTITFELCKGETGDSLHVEFADGTSGSRDIKLEGILASPTYAINYRTSEDAERILARMSMLPRLDSIGEAIQGITPYDRYQGQSAATIKSRAFHSATKKDKTYAKWLAGGDVKSFELSWSGEWISYGVWLAAPRDPRFFTGPRILFREIPGKDKRIQAAYADKTYYHGHSITPFKLHDQRVDVLYLLGIVNSKLLSWYAQNRLSNFGKDVFPKLNPADIKNLPIVIPDRSDKNGMEGHDAIARLVLDVLEMKKALANATGASKDELLRRKCNHYELEIDRFVYRLYGLSDDEIRIVEGPSAP